MIKKHLATVLIAFAAGAAGGAGAAAIVSTGEPDLTTTSARTVTRAVETTPAPRAARRDRDDRGGGERRTRDGSAPETEEAPAAESGGEAGSATSEARGRDSTYATGNDAPQTEVSQPQGSGNVNVP
jgi:hypothetical protein